MSLWSLGWILLINTAYQHSNSTWRRWNAKWGVSETVQCFFGCIWSLIKCVPPHGILPVLVGWMLTKREEAQQVSKRDVLENLPIEMLDCRKYDCWTSSGKNVVTLEADINHITSNYTIESCAFGLIETTSLFRKLYIGATIQAHERRLPSIFLYEHALTPILTQNPWYRAFRSISILLCETARGALSDLVHPSISATAFMLLIELVRLDWCGLGCARLLCDRALWIGI